MVTFTFDKVTKTIAIASPDTLVTVQELVNAIREWEQELWNLEEDSFIVASGKEDLGGGVSVAITLELLNDWRVQFEARAGPDWEQCIVKGGNLVATNAYNNNPIKNSAYVQVTIAQSSSATLINADPDTIAAKVWEEDITGYTGDKAGYFLMLAKRALANKLTIDTSTSKLQIWDDTGTSIIAEWDITDKDGQPVVLQGTGPVHRGVQS